LKHVGSLFEKPLHHFGVSRHDRIAERIIANVRSVVMDTGMITIRTTHVIKPPTKAISTFGTDQRIAQNAMSHAPKGSESALKPNNIG